MPRFVLAYSGGLDTSVMLKWLQLEYGAEVVTVTADLGQKKELVGVSERALAGGASAAHVLDLRDDFVDGYVWPTLKAGALYQGVYPMATAIGRPLIAKSLVAIARAESADAIVHGCTGKGNDQVRFETAIGCYAPDLKCIAPLRTWDLKTREQEIDWAREHGVPVAATKASPYSIDENLWGVSVECGSLEDPWAEPPADCWQLTAAPDAAPNHAETITIGFESGVPVALDHERLPGVILIGKLSDIAAQHGVGRLDIVEDRVTGIKSREVYEAPAAVVLHAAREALEQLTLDRETRRVKAGLGQEMARLAYDGLWPTPLRRSIEAFVNGAAEHVTGTVRVKLFKGTATVTGRESPHSLYRPSLATYGEGDQYHHGSAAGFIDIFAQGARIANAVEREASAPAAPVASLEGAVA